MNRSLLRFAFLAVATVFLAVPVAGAQSPNPVPTTFRSIYPASSQANSQVDQAIKLAAEQNKRVLLDFGTDQCADCQVLEEYLEEEPNKAQIEEHFVLVHIDVGKKLQQNRALAQKYGIPLKKGVPALAVVDGQGHVLYAQANGEFKNARFMGANDITVFLNKWRG
jgi:thiol:disulfide interchange protein